MPRRTLLIFSSLAILFLCLSVQPIHAQEHLTPQQFIEQFMEAYNLDDNEKKETLVKEHPGLASNAFYYLLDSFVEKSVKGSVRSAQLNLVVANSFAEAHEAVTGQKIWKQLISQHKQWSLDEKRQFLKADSWRQEGEKLYRSDKIQKALSIFRQALVTSRHLGDQRGEGADLNNMGNVYDYLGRYDEALEYHQKALNIFRRLGDRRAEGSALTNIGRVHLDLSGYEEALEHFRQALIIDRELDDLRYKGIDLALLGGAYWALGRYKETMDLYKQALTIFRDLRDRGGEASTLIYCGAVYRDIGRYGAALEQFNSALSIYRELGFRSGEGIVRSNIGVVYQDIGRYDEALEQFNLALAISRELGKRRGEAADLTNIGVVHENLGNYKEALQYYQRALAIHHELRNQLAEGITLANIGSAHQVLGRFREALKSYDKSLLIFKKLGARLEEGSSLTNIGLVYWHLGRYQRSLEYLNDSEERLKTLGSLEKHWIAQRGLGRTLVSLQRPEEAVEWYRKAIKTIEGLRGDLEKEIHRQSYFGERVWVYEELIELLLQLGLEEEAFHYMERARARVFLDMLATREVVPSGRIASEQNEEIKALERLVANLREKAVAEKNKPEGQRNREVLESVTSELRKAEEKYAALIKKVQYEDPWLASLVTVQALTVKEVQKLLDPNVALVSYFTTRKQLITFILTKEGLEAHTAPVTSEELANEVSAFRQALKDPSSRDYLEKGRTLFQRLVPTLYTLRKRHLIIVPNGPLHYLPFQVLTNDGERFLVEDFSITYLPSASVLRFINKDRQPAAGSLLALGNPNTSLPPLPYAEWEVAAINQLFPKAKVVTKAQATETLGKTESNGASILHIASHASFNKRLPLLSYLALTKDDKEDGNLYVHDVFGLDLSNTSLVTLSACETGLSKINPGDELVGLSRAFLYAGTPSLVASLWQVNDASTALLMREFYRNLKTMNKSGALRQAQLALLKGRIKGSDAKALRSSLRGAKLVLEDADLPPASADYRHPFYWAPFVLIGEGR